MPLLRGRIFETGRSEGASEKGPSSRVPVHVLPASIQAGEISIFSHIRGLYGILWCITEIQGSDSHGLKNGTSYNKKIKKKEFVHISFSNWTFMWILVPLLVPFFRP